MTTALILFLLIVLFSLLFADTGWSNVLSTTRNEVVFADRNHAYGAYRIRQEHHRVMVLAFSGAVLFATALAAVPRLMGSDMVKLPSPPVNDDGGIIFDLPPRDEKPEEAVKPPADPPPTGPDAVVDPNLIHAIVIDTLGTTSFDTVQVVKGEPGTATTGMGIVNPPVSGGGTTATVSTGTSPVVLPTGKFADKQPEYVGGERAMYAYLDRETSYPGIALDGRVEGVVYVEFVVDTDGSLTGISIARGVSKELDTEALRVVRRMQKWKPGSYQGQAVPVRFRLPIRFVIGE